MNASWAALLAREPLRKAFPKRSMRRRANIPRPRGGFIY